MHLGWRQRGGKGKERNDNVFKYNVINHICPLSLLSLWLCTPKYSQENAQTIRNATLLFIYHNTPLTFRPDSFSWVKHMEIF